MIDFNDIPTPLNPAREDDREALRQALLTRLDSVLLTLFPAGKMRHNTFHIGDVHGSPGDSLEIVLTGEKSGLWTDRADGDGGDLFDLIAAHHGIDAHREFATVLNHARDLLGQAPTLPTHHQREAPTDELGPATAKWDYHDAHGHLIAVVYRYDPPGSKKVFRPWDVRRRKSAPPQPRPLYNQPGLLRAPQVILVEGEKCAQALIDIGLCATTAMQGANAPVEKTDWSPLAGKTVLLWPDRDKPGWDYALRAAEAVLAAGATSCALLLPPDDKPDGWDAADAIVEGFDVAGFLAAGARLPIRPPLAAVPSGDRPPPVDDPTEDGLATTFTDQYGEDWRYCAAWGKWLVWTGARWNSDQVLYVLHLARGICRAASRAVDNPRLRAKLAAVATYCAAEKAARCDPTHAATAQEWDADPWLLNTVGGVIDLRVGQLREHRRGDRMTKLTTATPHGDCPRWHTFLKDVTLGDTALMAYLQRMVGYGLTGITREHALFFLYGTGANGKSVFVNVISTILGDYAANAPMDTFMETRSDRHPTDLAGLRGARFVCATETEQGRRWNESKLKAITGGDKIAARFMRQDFFEYVPQFKLVIAGNHKPAIRNIDVAMKRRLHLIPFTVTIPPEKRDGTLTDKLLQERDGILAWAVEGCLRWQRAGLKPPPVVVDATHEYFESEDALGQWLDERCQRSTSLRAGVSELFADWRNWAEHAGEYVGSVKHFSEQLVARHFEKCRLTGGARALIGLSLQPPSESPRHAYRTD